MYVRSLSGVHIIQTNQTILAPEEDHLGRNVVLIE